MSQQQDRMKQHVVGLGQTNRGEDHKMMKISEVSRLFAVLLVLTSPGLADDETRTLVAFGDSTTATRGELRVFANLLQDELPERGLPVRVVNAGVGGNNTNHARARFEKDVLAHKPDVVVVQFGINDAAVDLWKDPPAKTPRVNIETYVENLRYILQTLKSRDTNVVLLTPNPLRWTPKLRELYGKPPYRTADKDGFNVLLRQYAEKVRDLARTEKVPLVDVYKDFDAFGKKDGQSVNDLLLDGMHPNELGHRRIAEQLIALLSPARDRRPWRPPCPCPSRKAWPGSRR